MATDILKEQYKDVQEENDQYKKLISQQKDHLVSLDKEVTELGSRIREKLKVPGGILKEKEKHNRYRDRISILETKFNQDTKKFDELLCSNRDYREGIAHLLQQKHLCCQMEEKLNRKLSSQQNITEKLEERSALASNQRSEAATRMLEVRERMEEEKAQFTKRRLQLKTVVTHDAKLQSFIETKLQDIIPLEEDKDSKKKKKEQQYQTGVQKLEMYKQSYDTLVEVTGERDLHQIGQMFALTEQKNFARVTYINELQDRRSMLRNCSDKMKSDIRFLEENNKGHDEQLKGHLKDLESELQMCRCLSESLEKQISVVQRTLDQLATDIRDLLFEITGEAVVVTPDNITHFISALEEIINTLLIQANKVEDEEEEVIPQDVLLANSELLPGGEAVE